MICHCLSGMESETVVQWGGRARGDVPHTENEDWRALADSWAEAIQFREDDGWPMWSHSGEEWVARAADALPPALALALRARLALGRDAPTADQGWGEKLSGIRVAFDMQQANWLSFCALQARFGFTHAMAMDASEGEVVPVREGEGLDEWGWVKRRTAAAVVTHEGEVHGGCIADSVTPDSYVGELSALLVGLGSAPAGSRLLLVLDSTSPVKAWLKFRRQGDRVKRQYKAAQLLASLEEAVRRHSLVYFLWQRSHCGSPANEWADQAAECFRRQGDPTIQVEKCGALSAALWPARVQGPLFSWAIEAGARAAHGSMQRRAGRDWVAPSVEDWDIGLLQGEVGAAASLLRDDRLMVADAGHVVGRRERDEVGRASCPLGCEGHGGTWFHYAFDCGHRRLREERGLWERCIQELGAKLGAQGRLEQIQELMAMVRRGTVENSCEGDTALVQVRRMLCGFVPRAKDGCGGGKGTREAVRGTVVRGLQLLCTAAKLEDNVRYDVEVRIRQNCLLKRMISGWRRLVMEGGPLRAAAKRQSRILGHGVAWLREVLRSEGGGPRTWREMVVGSAEEDARTARQEAEQLYPVTGEEAVVSWYIQMRWWGRWAGRPGKQCNARWTGWTSAAQRALDTIERAHRGCFEGIIRWRADSRRQETTRESGEAHGRWLAEKRSWIGEMLCAENRHARACRAFYRLGGYRRLRKARDRMIKENEARKVQAMRRSLENFMAGGACSGGDRAVIPEEHRIQVNIGKRARECEATRATARLWKEGRQANNRGQWAVDEVLRVRRSLEHRGFEVLVAWMGPHEPSWVRMRDLSAQLRGVAWEMLIEPCRQLMEERMAGREEARRKREDRTAAEVRIASLGGRGRKSPRLVEKEERERRLDSAIVPYVKPRGGEESTATNLKRRRVKRVWGAHSVNGEEHVHVKWAGEETACEAVVPLAWLTNDWHVVVPDDHDADVCLRTFSAGTCQDAAADGVGSR